MPAISTSWQLLVWGALLGLVACASPLSVKGTIPFDGYLEYRG